MKFVIVVLTMGVNEQVAMDYFSCAIVRNNNVFGVIREEKDVEDTIKTITENKVLIRKDERKVSFSNKKIKIIDLEVE